MKNGKRYSQIFLNRFGKNKLAVISLVFVLLLAFVAIAAPFIANDRPLILKYKNEWYFPVLKMNPHLMDADLSGSFAIYPPVPFRPSSYDLDSILEPPSLKHILGTDGNGRDIASQIIWGARISLSVGVVAVGLAVIIGIIFGALAGFYGGITDIVISRLIEVMICFPTFFLILAALAFVGPSIYNIMIVIGITGWTGIARLVRGECLKLRKREFVTAAVVAGASNRRIILKHLVPAAMAPVMVSASFGVAGAILVESSLSFLGFGVPLSTPSWGGLLSQAQQYMDIAWWLTLVPGSAIFVTITAYNLLGEGIREAIDPI